MRPKFPRTARSLRKKTREQSHSLRAPIDAEPAVVNPAGYQEAPLAGDTVAQDRKAADNDALLHRARAEDDGGRATTAPVPAPRRGPRGGR